MKNKTVVKLSYYDGSYNAIIYYVSGSYCNEKKFIWYTKKEVIDILRNEYNCIVSNKVIKGMYDYTYTF